MYDNVIIIFNLIFKKWFFVGLGLGILVDVFFRVEFWDFGNYSFISCGLSWDSLIEYVFVNLYEW